MNGNEPKPLDTPEEGVDLNEQDTSEEVRVKTISPEALAEAVKSKDKIELDRIFSEVADIDIAEAASQLDIKDLILLFRDVNSQQTAPLFHDLSQDKKEELVKALTDKDLIKLINEQAADDLADTVGDMPANLATKVLRAAGKDMRSDINQILKFKPDSAGAIMTTEYLEFKESQTVGDTIEAVRTIGREAETVYTIFVRDSKRQFVGTVDLDDLIFAHQDQKLSAIMNKDAPSVHVETDKEEVANVIRRYDLNAVAVLNDDECLTGIVTVDDAVDVLAAEANEDIEKMNAIAPMEDSFLETHPWRMAKKCLPWICILLFLDTFSTIVVDQLQYKFEIYKILIAFIPAIMDTAGNAGGQTIAIVIRGLATKEFEPKEFKKVLGHEAMTALIIGAGSALFGFLWFIIEQYLGLLGNTALPLIDGRPQNIWNGNCWNLDFLAASLQVASSVGVTLLISIFLSKVVAVILPMGAAAIKKDPAIVSQPLLTTIVDVSSLLIYLGAATLIILAWI